AIFDTVDKNFYDKWLANIKEVIGQASPDYLVVQHMEPDHAANVAKFAADYPDTKIVASAAAFNMMINFFEKDFSDRGIKVTDGDSLELGSHKLNFVTAPMVHWPEVIMSYESSEKVLFSSDAFGKFGAFDCDEDWACEARRYYFGIVGKYGTQVQAVLKKAAGLDIDIICSSHGPILRENLGYYLDLYDKWSSYTPEEKGVFIAYSSVYGHTEQAAQFLAKELETNGAEKVDLVDLSREDMAENVEDAFRYDRLVIATTTYNMSIFPSARIFIEELLERGYKNRKIAIIENGSWAPAVIKNITEKFANSENIEFVEPFVSIRSSMKEQDKQALKELAANLCKG
ncbi:MAG: FprA family A-type flavoprotein, partial [Enterococcus sp.]|nr:FprA family A-type flavoprotein [Enterococcus sp.]